MSSSDRRTFLIRMAKGAMYAAPVVHTLAAPESASGQAPPSQKMAMMNMGGGMGMGMGMGMNNANVGVLGRTAPWFRPPPGGD